MSRKKGEQKTGGRVSGTPNKVTSEMKTWLSGLIDKNRRQIERDLKLLEPKDRLLILERLMQYAIPKQQSISIEAQIQAEYASLEILLSNAPIEAINEITERIMKLNQLNKQSNE